MTEGATPPSSPAPPLPVWKTFCEALRLVFVEHLRELPRALLIPLVLVACLSILQSWAQELLWISFRYDKTPYAPLKTQALQIVGLVLKQFFITIFAVSWFRLLLVGPSDARPHWLQTWTDRHWRFFGLLVALQIAVYAIGVPLVSVLLWAVNPLLKALFDALRDPSLQQAALVISTTIWPFVFAALTLALARIVAPFAFLFAATTVWRGYDIKVLWISARGSAYRFVSTLLCVGLAAEVLSQATFHLSTRAYVVGVVVGDAALKVRFVLELLLVFVCYAVVIAVCSLAFRHCTGWVPPARGHQKEAIARLQP